PAVAVTVAVTVESTEEPAVGLTIGSDAIPPRPTTSADGFGTADVTCRKPMRDEAANPRR
ncbi:MAG TPA: hypothetical protein VMT43_02270, partial [Acidimicrobiales bacterium]|nr:hypothetical protein [Acidimicrobiales bacterium]